MFDEYYTERGWDIITAILIGENLLELGLKYIADELVKR